MWLFVHALSATIAQTGSPVLEAAWARFQREMLIEGAGVFWIVAELAILYAVTVGGRVLRERPLPKRISLSRRERWLAAGLAGLAIALTAAVYGRFLIWVPMPAAVEATAALDPPDIPRAVYAAVRDHVQVHVAIWCAFIAAWIVLETAIVVQGIRAFHALADLIRAQPPRFSTATALVLAAGAALLWTTPAGAQIDQAIETAMRSGYKGALNDARAGYRFMEFYLRVAGAVWVLVEWIAAVYLIRGYIMLRRFFRERAHVA